VFPNDQCAVAQGEALIGKGCNGGVERRMPNRYRPSRRNKPSDVLSVRIPQLNAIGHLGMQFVQVRVRELTKQSIYFVIEFR